jgi:hypothetical protein
VKIMKCNKSRLVGTAEAEEAVASSVFVPCEAEEANIFQDLTSRMHRNWRWYVFGTWECETPQNLIKPFCKPEQIRQALTTAM